MKDFIFLLGIFLIIFSISMYRVSPAAGEGAAVDIDARVVGCGDGVVDLPEDCDGSALNSQTCTTRGFTSGTLSCTASCVFNTTACILDTPSGGGGGGGVNRGGTSVVFAGKAYPKSIVTLLKDARIIATTIAGVDARFQIYVSDLASGNYIFSTYSEDNKGLRSSLLTFPVSVTKNILTKIDDIFLAPTISVDKSQVRKGDPLVIFGQTTPSSEVTIEMNSEQQFFVKTPADPKGIYLHNFDTSVLEKGQHHTRARALHTEDISPQSLTVGFVVGSENIFASSTKKVPKADLNGDSKVNLIDFSILAFWYNRLLTPAFIEREKKYLNGDGKVNLVDFSMMAFNWTG